MILMTKPIPYTLGLLLADVFAIMNQDTHRRFQLNMVCG